MVINKVTSIAYHGGMDEEGRYSAALMNALGDGNAPTWFGHAKAKYQGDESLGYVATYAVITESRLYWEKFDGPPLDIQLSPSAQGIVVHVLDFHDAVRMHQDHSDVIHILTQPFDVEGSRFTHSQSQFIDNSFLFYDEAAGDALLEAMKYSRGAMADCFGIELLAMLNRVPVSKWAICPLCGGRLLRQTQHAAECSLDGHYFSDPNSRPVISLEPHNYGTLIGDEPFEKMDELLIRDGHTWGDRTLVFQLVPLTEESSLRLLRFDETTTTEAAQVRGLAPRT